MKFMRSLENLLVINNTKIKYIILNNTKNYTNYEGNNQIP